MKRNLSGKVALGGILAAMAVVIMCLGGMIPVATYVCPVLCMLVQAIVFMFCGKRIAWAWFCAVSLLTLLLGPDKEAVAVFLMLGYYPIIKPKMDSTRFRPVWKLLYFNISIVLVYTALVRLLGIGESLDEFHEFGWIGLGVMLILGNITFLFADKLLNTLYKKMR